MALEVNLFEHTGSAFDEKLNRVVGVFNAVRASETQRHQMLQKVEQQKELIQFQSDVQFDQRMRIHEEIERPQIDTQQQIQERQQLLKNIEDSYNKTEQELKSLQQNKANEDTVNRFNLLDGVRFTGVQDPETGVWRTAILEGEQEISFGNYQDKLSDSRFLATKLEEIEAIGEDLQEGEDDIFSGRGLTITRNNYRQVLRDVRQDPATRDLMLRAFREEAVDMQQAEENIVGDDPLPHEAQQIAFRAKNNPVESFDFQMTQGFWNRLFKDPEVSRVQINHNKSVGDNIQQIESFLEALDIPLTDMPDDMGLVDAMLRGETDELADRYQDISKQLAPLYEQNPQQMKTLMEYYIKVPKMLQHFNNTHGTRAGRLLNLAEAKINVNIGSDPDLGKVFVPAEQSSAAQELERRAIQYITQ